MFNTFTDIFLEASLTNSDSKKIASSISSILFKKGGSDSKEGKECSVKFLNDIINVIITGDVNIQSKYLSILDNTLRNKENAIYIIWDCYVIKISPDSLKSSSLSLEEKGVLLDILLTIFKAICKVKENNNKSFDPSRSQFDIISNIYSTLFNLKFSDGTKSILDSSNKIKQKINELYELLKDEFLKPVKSENKKKETKKEEKKSSTDSNNTQTSKEGKASIKSFFDQPKKNKDIEQRRKEAEIKYPYPAFPDYKQHPSEQYDDLYALDHGLCCPVKMEV